MENKPKENSVIFDGESKLTGKYHLDVLGTFDGEQFHISGRGLNRKEATEDLVARILRHCLKKITNN